MTIAVLAVLGGLLTLVWGANLFVDGAAVTARRLGAPPLLVGMLVVGFGTSAPEMVVSAMAAAQGNPGLALGNAYGSNISNIALILGLTAVINPISMHPRVMGKELPILGAVTLVAAAQLYDGWLSRTDALALLGLFFLIMGGAVWQGLTQPDESLAGEVEKQLGDKTLPLKSALLRLGAGLILLVASSRVLVWGAVSIAQGFGVSDLIIGLTVVALGTSLPELASSAVAARKGEHDIALGNILGSNLFNTLAVVGIAGAIHPTPVAPEVLSRDCVVMGALTLFLFVFGFRYGRRGPGRINRWEGGGLVLCYAAYTSWLIRAALSGQG